MEKMSYNEFEELIEKLKNGEKATSDIEKVVENLLKCGNKHIKTLENIFKSDGELTYGQISEYSDRIIALVEKAKFASDLLVKELSVENIESFDPKKWQSIAKIAGLPKLEYSQKRACLALCSIYGIFEEDANTNKRFGELQDILQNSEPSELEKYSKMELRFDPQFLKLMKEMEKSGEISQETILEIQLNWPEISKGIEHKSLANILRFLEVSKQTNDKFDTYMQVNNIPKTKVDKYKMIYEKMVSRTRASMPTVSGKSENGYTYELLNFDDIRIMRFGENVKCCQKLGGNGESSMVYSAIESNARIMMISDEDGDIVAGSLVTHQIDKNGKSYVCFDSIEVNANKNGIKAKEYTKTLARIEKLKRKGILKEGSLEEIKQYCEEHPDQQDIKPRDISSIEANKKILDTYQSAIDAMIAEDKEKRNEQLQNGEITQEEYSSLLMQNGLFTAGRNPVSMYLGDLEQLDNKSMEKLPVPQKDRSFYKRIYKSNGLDNKFMVKLSNWLTGGLTAMAIATGSLPFILSSAALFSYSIYTKNKHRVKGVYSDALKDQRILRDGRDNSPSADLDRSQLKEKLFYNEFDVISKPRLFSKLPEDKQKQCRRLIESNLQRTNPDGELPKLDDKYIIGNMENWAGVLSREDDTLVLTDVVMPNPMKFSRDKQKINENQQELLTTLTNLSKIDGLNLEIKCQNKRINKYLSRAIAKKQERTPIRDMRSNTQQTLGYEH